MSDKGRPRKRMVVSDAALPHIARGGRIFGRQIVDLDLDVADGEDVLVIDSKNRVLTTARALL